MNIIRNAYRLATGRHRALIMDVSSVRERIAKLSVARHRYCTTLAGGDDLRYRLAHNEWTASPEGEELAGLQFWLEYSR